MDADWQRKEAKRAADKKLTEAAELIGDAASILEANGYHVLALDAKEALECVNGALNS